MKVIAVMNRKGGVGKSTMTTHIAAGLALAGFRVAIVDTDSQGHAGQMFELPDENGLYDALIVKKPLKEIVRLVPTNKYMPDGQVYLGNDLFVLPSSDLTYRIPYELKQHETFLFLEKLEELGALHNLDVILIDTNPTLSLFDGAVYLAADAYIYVTECERLSMDGVQTAIDQMSRAKQQREKYLHRESRILGIIPNKMRANTYIHRTNISIIADAFPDLVWPPVILRTAWVEAANVQEMIYRFAPNGQECRDAYAITTKVMEALQWQTSEIG